MAITFSYDIEHNILSAHCSATITLQELQESFATITTSADYPADVPTLWDCRELDFSQLERDFEEGIIALRTLHPERGAARIAIVTSGNLGYGLSRMYELKSVALPQQMMVFKDMDEARKWLMA